VYYHTGFAMKKIKHYIDSTLRKRPPNSIIGITDTGARARAMDTLLEAEDTIYPTPTATLDIRRISPKKVKNLSA
jgi:hypothetical protein